MRSPAPGRATIHGRGRPLSSEPARRAGLLCGLVAPLLWAAVIVIAGELRPGFDHVGQYISELGERGSTTETFMRYGGFVATGGRDTHVAQAIQVRVDAIENAGDELEA